MTQVCTSVSLTWLIFFYLFIYFFKIFILPHPLPHGNMQVQEIYNKTGSISWIKNNKKKTHQCQHKIPFALLQFSDWSWSFCCSHEREQLNQQLCNGALISFLMMETYRSVSCKKSWSWLSNWNAFQMRWDRELVLFCLEKKCSVRISSVCINT